MVAASSPTANWQPLGPSSFYRSTRAFDLQASDIAHLDLSDYLVQSAKCGGPLALMRDPAKPVLVTDQAAFTRDKGTFISVYSAAGKILQTISWDSPSPVVSFLYPSLSTSVDTLLLLTRSGLYRLYPLHTHPSLPAPYTQHQLPSAEESGGVVDARPAGEGAVVVRLADGRFVELSNLGRGPQQLGEGGGGSGEDEGFPSLPSMSFNSASASAKRRREAPAAPKVVPFASTGLTVEEIRGACWTVLPGEVSSTRGTEVLVGLSDGRVLRVDEIDGQEQRLPTPAPILHLTPSPSGRFLAVLTASSLSHSQLQPPYTLQVLTSDLSRLLSSCDLTFDATGGQGREGGGGRPRQVEWCGSNSVALGYVDEGVGTGTVVVVGPFGETLKYFYSSAPYLTSEVDCVRIICPSENCELLEMVPQSTHRTLLPLSAHPSAQLYTASQAFHLHKSPRADELIRTIGRGPEMREAVEECVEAAGREWGGGGGGEGRGLLQAAAFGKSWLDAYNPSSFVETTKALRVLNAVREWKVGLALSWEQYHLHPPSHLITRLLSLNQHLLALRISTFLSLPAAPIIRHWALQLIASSAPGVAALKGDLLSDEQVCAAIVEKLDSLSSKTSCSSSSSSSSAPHHHSTSPLLPTSLSATNTPSTDHSLLSPADLALPAFHLGRPKLAKLLVEKETKRAKQVPLLVRMGEGKMGLRRAVEGGDLDLVFAVFLSLRRTLPAGDLFRIIERVDASLTSSSSTTSSSSNPTKLTKPPSAPAPSTSTSSSSSPRKPPPVTRLFELFVREHGGEEERRVLRELWYQDDRRVEMGLEGMRESLVDSEQRIKRLGEARKAFGEDKESGFETKMLDDHLRLLAFQQSLESDFPGKKIVGLSINDTIRACIVNGLEKTAEKVKSDFKVPDKRYWYIHLRSLILLRSWDNLSQFASRKRSPIGYEPFVSELIKAGAHREAVKYVERCEGRNRVELFVRCGEWVSAGHECVRRAERGKLIELKSRAPNQIILAQLEELLQEMSTAGM
ncbi:hypothetical protein JCM11641_006619 [Rhodosporidiobolus odoratus]